MLSERMNELVYRVARRCMACEDAFDSAFLMENGVTPEERRTLFACVSQVLHGYLISPEDDQQFVLNRGFAAMTGGIAREILCPRTARLERTAAERGEPEGAEATPNDK